MTGSTLIHSLLLTTLTLLAGGCLTQEAVTPRVFRLAGCGTAQRADGNGPVVRIAAVQGASSLHEAAIVYRLDYTSGGTRGRYGRGRWAEPPASMLTADLRAGLARGPWRAVLGPDVDAHADWTLTPRVDELVHAFTAPGKSYASLQASLLVADSRGRVLAQRELHHRVPAATADVVGGVAAMDRAEKLMCADAAALLESVYRRRWTDDARAPIEDRQ